MSSSNRLPYLNSNRTQDNFEELREAMYLRSKYKIFMTWFYMCQLPNKISCTQFEVVQGELCFSQHILVMIVSGFQHLNSKNHNEFISSPMSQNLYPWIDLEIQFHLKLVSSECEAYRVRNTVRCTDGVLEFHLIASLFSFPFDLLV